MKRYGYLYEKLYDFANLEDAYRKARKCRRYRNEVLRYTARLEENLIILQNHLIWKSYKQGDQRVFYVSEPKLRKISALPFRDRVAHHAINNILEPIFDKGFYYHSYACRAGKGNHAASQTLSKWIRNLTFEGKELYGLKADIKGYFPSVKHSKLKEIIRRKIKDPDVLWLCDLVIDSGSDSGRGIPVGNLTSQLFANIYLDPFDKFIKEKLRVKYYARYMDDFVILSHSKEELYTIWNSMERFLNKELELTLNAKTAIIAAKNGVDFCGYRHYYSYRKLRKRSVIKMRRAIRARYKKIITPERFVRTVESWLAHISYADTYRIRTKILHEIEETLNYKRE